MKISRRDFIKTVCFSGAFSRKIFADSPDRWRREARYYTKLPGNKVGCDLCPNYCIINEGKRGLCRVRENQKGRLYTLVYGRLCSMNIDPVEKKPLYHFLPGKQALSVATAGCNVQCKFCQNWTIAQVSPEEINARYYSPENLIKIAKQYDTPIIAFTYSEPVIFYEYMLAVAKIAQQEGIKTVMISNGYINEAPLKELCKYITAIKVDFKGYSEEFYQKIVRGKLQPVLDTMKRIRQEKVWLEIVNLLIPKHNDAPEQIAGLCHWVMAELGPNVPVHFSRFHPQYLMKNLPPTSTKTLKKAYEIAQKTGLNYVYLGNIPQRTTDDTFCPKCNSILIERKGYSVTIKGMEKNHCRQCGEIIPGIWN